MTSLILLRRKLAIIKTILDNEWLLKYFSLSEGNGSSPYKRYSFLFSAETNYFRLSGYSGCSLPFADQWWCFLSYHINPQIKWLAWLNSPQDVPCLVAESLVTSGKSFAIGWDYLKQISKQLFSKYTSCNWQSGGESQSYFVC